MNQYCNIDAFTSLQCIEIDKISNIILKIYKQTILKCDFSIVQLIPK